MYKGVKTIKYTLVHKKSYIFINTFITFINVTVVVNTSLMKDEVDKMVKKTEIETLTTLLETLNSRDVEASSVISVDGFMIASVLPQNTRKERVAVMAAAMLSLGETAARELQCGKVSEVYIRGKNGAVVVMASGKDTLLTTLTNNGAVDTVSETMRKTAEKVAELV
jgi:predicted regulator of Ras-like GTPase activity (Roadblock/LC7/MglB family)